MTALYPLASLHISHHQLCSLDISNESVDDPAFKQPENAEHLLIAAGDSNPVRDRFYHIKRHHVGGIFIRNIHLALTIKEIVQIIPSDILGCKPPCKIWPEYSLPDIRFAGKRNADTADHDIR